MVAITAEQMRDFTLCRYLYEQRHIEDIPQKITLPERDKLVYEFEQALLTTIKFFHFEAMGGKLPTLKTLLWKWDKLWFRGTTAEDILHAEDHPNKNRNSYNTDAHVILHDFYRKNASDPGEVIFINERYEVPLTSRAKATGEIELVLRFKGKTVIRHYGTRTEKQFGPKSEGGYRVALDSIAYRHKTESVENNVELYLLRNGKKLEHVVTDLEVKQVRRLADEMATCRVFPPAGTNYWCNSCQFARQCVDWQ